MILKMIVQILETRTRKKNTTFFWFYLLHMEYKAEDFSQKAQRGGYQKCMARGKGKVLVKGTL